MKSVFIVFFISLFLPACVAQKDRDESQVSSLYEQVRETFEMVIPEPIQIYSGDDRRIPLGDLKAIAGSVLVFVSADMEIAGKDMNDLKLTIIEPPYNDDGFDGYQHILFESVGHNLDSKQVVLNNQILLGNNPGDEEVSGIWYLQINSGDFTSATIQSLSIKVHTRLD